MVVSRVIEEALSLWGAIQGCHRVSAADVSGLINWPFVCRTLSVFERGRNWGTTYQFLVGIRIDMLNITRASFECLQHGGLRTVIYFQLVLI